MTNTTILWVLVSANILVLAWNLRAAVSMRRSQKRADDVFEAMVLASTMQKDAA